MSTPIHLPEPKRIPPVPAVMAPKPCFWTEMDEGDYWQASCASENRGSFCFNGGDTPKAHGFDFCPFCGKSLVEIPFINAPEGEE